MTSAVDACEIRIDNGITIVKLLTEFNYEMGLEVINYLSDNNLYEYRVIDYNGFSWHINHNEVVSMTNYSKSAFPEKNFVAFSANDDLAYGTLRELSVFRAQEGFTQVGVFRTLQESLDWMQAHKHNNQVH